MRTPNIRKMTHEERKVFKSAKKPHNKHNNSSTMRIFLLFQIQLLLLLLLSISSSFAVPTAELGETSGPCDSDVTGKPCGPVDGYVGTCVLSLQ